MNHTRFDAFVLVSAINNNSNNNNNDNSNNKKKYKLISIIAIEKAGSWNVQANEINQVLNRRRHQRTARETVSFSDSAR